ncbi:EAL domain-containing protein [Cellvibrio sp. KY-GH-1]|nr:EAL domain-containing protein [Cellvibrio sp. KY-GH-1]
MEPYLTLPRTNLPQTDLDTSEDTAALAIWRQRLLDRLLGVLLVAAWVVGLPSISLAIYEQLWILVCADIIAVSWLHLLHAKRNWSYRWRVVQLLGLIYMISVCLLISIGYASQIYLMAMPVLAVLLFSLRTAILCLLLNGATLMAIGYFFQADSVGFNLAIPPLLRWAAITINFMLIDTALTAACAFLLNGLKASLAEQQVNAQLLADQAMHDPLTGLANRRLLEDRTRQAIAQAQRRGGMVAVVMFDIDRFKAVNDGHGHALGDALIMTCAERLTAIARREDTVARFGGDEFVVVLTQLQDENDLLAAVKRLHQMMAGKYLLQGLDLHVNTSMGVAVYLRDGEDTETLIKHADMAMYHAKETGRGRFQFFQATMNERLTRRLQLENALRNALANGELQLYFQPRVSADGHPCGGEVLLRWFHPELGSISPAQFIPIAEDTGLILPIGSWVLRTAAEHLARWQKIFPAMHLSVNISPRQFFDESLLPEIHAASSLVAKGSFEVEITESLAMNKPAETAEFLRQLRDSGVGVSMDDFGTGFSSLARLKTYPLDVLKIDQSFIRGIEHDPADVAIVKTIIELANNLNLGTVAEGVETEGQATIMRALGVKEMQGYLFAKPMPAEDYLAWWHQQEKKQI